MKAIEQKKAIKLRENGESIKEIAKIIGVSKGSVSIWVRNVKLNQKQYFRLKAREHSRVVIEKRRATRLRNELNKRNIVVEIAKKDIRSLSKDSLRVIGSVLYWAEGRKKGHRIITFSNSDPIMVRIMMRFFREICEVENSKFRGHIHTYSHLNSKNAEKYWSSVSGIPLGQFYKTYSKPSKSSKNKMDSLPNGTFDIYVNDSILFLTIKGWIEKISDLILK